MRDQKSAIEEISTYVNAMIAFESEFGNWKIGVFGGKRSGLAMTIMFDGRSAKDATTLKELAFSPYMTFRRFFVYSQDWDLIFRLGLPLRSSSLHQIEEARGRMRGQRRWMCDREY